MSSPLVGLVDQAIPSAAQVSWNVNKIGGLPAWLHKAPAQTVWQCKKCDQQLSLLTQLYCPLGHSPYHRCLYVFVCLSQGCPLHNQFRIFRCNKFDPSYNKAELGTGPQSVPCPANDDMWTEDQDDWGDEDDEWGSDDNSRGQLKDNNSSNMSSYEGDLNMCHNVTASSYQDSSSLSTVSGSQPNSSQGLSSASVLDSSIGVELPVAVSKMTISDGEIHQSHSDSTKEVYPTVATPQQVPSSTCPHEKDGVVGEDIGPSSNRYEELARILNTKFNTEQRNDTSMKEDSQSNVATMFEAYYLYVIEEPKTEDPKVSKHVAELIKEYEKTEGKQLETLISEGARSKGKGSTESYEKSELKHGDRTFHKFLKKLQTCPDQCIRYDRGGSPLLAMELKGQNSCIPPCPHCGNPRVFEFQLLPALIPWLTSSECGASVEFSTVLIFTCQDNCVISDHKEALIEEVAILQEDPDQHLFR